MLRSKHTLSLLPLLFSVLFGCNGGVEHPPHGQPNQKDYCAGRDTMENNCMACSAQPGCGWCNSPHTGEAQCQPGASSERPPTCETGWAFSSEECTAPPPPL